MTSIWHEKQHLLKRIIHRRLKIAIDIVLVSNPKVCSRRYKVLSLVIKDKLWITIKELKYF